MISVQIQGGLGNQMFQYAFACSVSNFLNTPFTIRTNSKFVLGRYFVLPNFSSAKNNLKETFFLPKRRKKIEDNANALQVLEALTNSVHYTGFFQGLEYFESVQDLILEHFQIKSALRIDTSIKDEFDAVVHVRGTDYHKFKIPVCPNHTCVILKL